MNMTLSVDPQGRQRRYAAQFLDLVKKTLENPKEFTI